MYARTAEEFQAHAGSGTVWLINCDPTLTLRLGLWRKLHPAAKIRLVAVDLVLRRPKGLRDAVLMPVKRALLGEVDHFIHYFSDVRAYQETFGIDAARSSFVPFKSNLSESTSSIPTWAQSGTSSASDAPCVTSTPSLMRSSNFRIPRPSPVTTPRSSRLTARVSRARWIASRRM